MASEITVYNSQGYEYDEGGKTNRQDEYIRELIFANVRFIADTAGDTEFVTFFRGRESMAGRSEMFYARYVTTGTPDLEAFSRELESYVEDDLGLVMDATAEGVIYDRIGTDMRDLVTVDADDGLIGELLRGGDQLQFGVPDHDVAIGVLQKYISAADTIAICESADASVLSDIDIVVEVGSYAGTEPLGNTGQLIQEAKERREAARQPQGGGAGGGGHHAQHGLSRQQGPSRQQRLVRLGAVVIGVVVVAGLLVAAAVFTSFVPNPLADSGPQVTFDGQDNGNVVTVNITDAEANKEMRLRIEGYENTNLTADQKGNANAKLVLPTGQRNVTLLANNSNGNMSIVNRTKLEIESPFSVTVAGEDLVTNQRVGTTVGHSPLSVSTTTDDEPVLYVNRTETPLGEIQLSEGSYNITVVNDENETLSGTVVVDYDGNATIERNTSVRNVVEIRGNASTSPVAVEANRADGQGSESLNIRKTAEVSEFNGTLNLPVQNGTWEITATANGTTLATETVGVDTSITSFTVNGEPYDPGMSVSGEVNLSGTATTTLTSVSAAGGEADINDRNFTDLTIQSGATTVVVTGENSGETVFVVELNLTWSSGGQGSLQADRSGPGPRTTAVSTRSLIPPRAARSAI